jgi:hypothetical protein
VFELAKLLFQTGEILFEAFALLDETLPLFLREFSLHLAGVLIAPGTLLVKLANVGVPAIVELYDLIGVRINASVTDILFYFLEVILDVLEVEHMGVSYRPTIAVARRLIFAALCIQVEERKHTGNARRR